MFSFKKKLIFTLLLAIMPLAALHSEQEPTKESVTPINSLTQQISTVCEYFYSPTGLLTVALTSTILKARGLAIMGLGALAFAYSDILMEQAKNYVENYNKASNADNTPKVQNQENK